MAGYIDTNRSSIVKLNTNNYHLWKFGAEMLLLKENLWEVTTSERPEKPDPTWTKADNGARGTIALSIDANLHYLICECTTAREMWTKIKTHFERASYSSKIFLKRRLYATKLEGHDMEDFIHKIMSIVDRLRLAGDLIEDDEIVSMLLCGLSEEYDNLITAIESRDEKKLKLEDVKLKLLDEARRRMEKNILTDQHTAMISNQIRFNKFNKQERLCYQCKRTGHIRANCPEFKSHYNETNKYREEYPRKEKTKYNGHQETNFSALSKPEEEEERSEYYHSFILIKNDYPKELTNKNQWIMDSGASNHMCSNKAVFSNYVIFTETKDVLFADGSKSQAMGKGNINLSCAIDDEIINIELKNVIHVPNIVTNLISISQLCKSGNRVVFDRFKCSVYSSDKLIMVGVKGNGLFKLSLKEISTEWNMSACIHTWHRRLGHRSVENIMKLKNIDNTDMKISKCEHDNFCKVCSISNISQKSFSTVDHKQSSKPFQLIHTDICSPISPMSKGGGNYFLIIVDDYSRYCFLKVIKYKSDATDTIKEYIKHNYNKFERYPQFVRSDGGGEYENNTLNEFLKDLGIVHQISIPYCQQQNGVSERMNRTLIGMVKAMLSENNLNKNLWGEAASTACYIYNRLIHSYTNSTPYKLWMGKDPKMGHIRTMGSQVVYWTPSKLRSKLDSNGKEGQLMGYGDKTKGYRVLDKETNKIIFSRSASFKEENYQMMKTAVDKPELELTFSLENDTSTNEGTGETELRRSTRTNIGTMPHRYQV